MPEADQKYSSGRDDPAVWVERGFAATGLAAAVAAGAAASGGGAGPWDVLAAGSLMLGVCAVLGLQVVAQVRRFGMRAEARGALPVPARIGLFAQEPDAAADGIMPDGAALPGRALTEAVAELAGAWELLGVQAERGACTASVLTQQAVGLTRDADELVRGVAAALARAEAVDPLREQAAAIAARLPAIEQAARAQNEVGQAMVHGAAVQADEVGRLRAQVAGILRPAPARAALLPGS